MSRPLDVQCPSGKIAHPDAAKARDHLRANKTRRGTRGRDDLDVYRCPECGAWHIGHRLGTRRDRRR